MEKRKEWIYVVCLTGFIAITFAFGRYIFSAITPEIVESLNIDYTFVGIINAGHQAAYLTFSMLGGILCSYLSIRALISSSVILCCISVFLLAFVNNPYILLIIVTLQGVFAAVSWIPMVEFVAENIQENIRGKAMGIISSGTSFGMILNGFLIPYILKTSDWHSVWFVFGIIAIVLGIVGIIWLYQLKETVDNVAGKCKNEKDMSEEKMNPKEKRNAIILTILLILTGIYLIPFQSYIVPVMQEDFGLSAQISGLAWSILGFIGIFSGFLGGILADITSAKKAMIIVHIVSIASIAAIVFFHNAVSALFACTIFGLTYNAIFGLHPTYVSKILPPEKTARLFGLLNLALGIGSMIGNYAGGLFQTLTGSFELTYIIMFVMSVVTVGICMLIEPDKRY